MPFIKNESAGYLANHMARLFARSLQQRIGALGLTTGVFPALLELWESDGLTQSELVRRLDIEQPTMANTLKRMERDGLVVRKANENDGRSRRVWLTDKARVLREPVLAAAEATNAEALANLDAGDRAAFVTLMQRAIESLQQP